ANGSGDDAQPLAVSLGQLFADGRDQLRVGGAPALGQLAQARDLSLTHATSVSHHMSETKLRNSVDILGEARLGSSQFERNKVSQQSLEMGFSACSPPAPSPPSPPKRPPWN